MFSSSFRDLWKAALWWTRVKIVYSRITLNKYTTLYFFFTLLNCIVLVILQAVAFADNSQAAIVVSELLQTGNVTRGLVVMADGGLQFCWDIPEQRDANCKQLVSTNRTIESRGITDLIDFAPLQVRNLDAQPQVNASGLIDGVKVGKVTLDTPCLVSLLWLADILRDARREDVVALVYQIWLFSLAIVTILNESLPHLTAALLGHVLATGWAAFRVSNSKHVQNLYQQLVVKGTCNNIDLLGHWWDIRYQHTIPVVVFNVVTLISACVLSSQLFKVYAAETFSRVGASPAIHTIYKLVLFLSVCLQLAGFFTLGATGIWIDKISSGTLVYLAHHLKMYTAAFGIVAVLELPWVVFGWLSVRREKRWMFAVFCSISVFLFAVSTALFFSPLYRFVFHCWPFFATMTVAAYILITVTSVMGVVCRWNFGKGLPQYLQVVEVPEGNDFTPVYFSSDPDAKVVDLEKSGPDSESDLFQIASLPYHQTTNYSRNSPSPPRPVKSAKSSSVRNVDRSRVISVYSDSTGETVKVSSTPPLFQDNSPLAAATSQESSEGSRSNGGAVTTRTSSLRKLPNDHIRDKTQGLGLQTNLSPKEPPATYRSPSSGPPSSRSPLLRSSPISRRPGLPLNSRQPASHDRTASQESQNGRPTKLKGNYF